MSQGNLILSRKPGESFTLFTSDGEVTIRINRCRRSGTAEVSVRAPIQVKVVRTELLDRGGKSGG